MLNSAEDKLQAVVIYTRNVNHFELYKYLSYAVPVIQLITSCSKCVMTTCVNTFAGICNVSDDDHNNNVNFQLKYDQFAGYKILF